MMTQNINLPIFEIKELCDRWQIVEFALFGSVLRHDFKPTSDTDVLITFAPNARKGLLTLARIKHELEDLLERDAVQQDIPELMTLLQPLLLAGQDEHD